MSSFKVPLVANSDVNGTWGTCIRISLPFAVYVVFRRMHVMRG
jgi:hypothetical protein